MLVNSGWQRCSGAKPDVHVQRSLVGSLCIPALRTGRVFVFQLMRFPQGENLALQILELICSSAVMQTFTFQLIARGKTHYVQKGKDSQRSNAFSSRTDRFTQVQQPTTPKFSVCAHRSHLLSRIATWLPTGSKMALTN